MTQGLLYLRQTLKSLKLILSVRWFFEWGNRKPVPRMDLVAMTAVNRFLTLSWPWGWKWIFFTIFYGKTSMTHDFWMSWVSGCELIWSDFGLVVSACWRSVTTSLSIFSFFGFWLPLPKFLTSTISYLPKAKRALAVPIPYEASRSFRIPPA